MDAVVRNLEVLGEAARHIPYNLRKKFPDIPWREISGMRNKLIHEYFGIDIEILQKTVYESLPKLKDPLSKMLQELNEGNDD